MAAPINQQYYIGENRQAAEGQDVKEEEIERMDIGVHNTSGDFFKYLVRRRLDWGATYTLCHFML